MEYPNTDNQPNAVQPSALSVATGSAVCAFCGEMPHRLLDCPASFTREKAVESLLRCRRLLDRAARELSECNERGSKVGDTLVREIATELLPPNIPSGSASSPQTATIKTAMTGEWGSSWPVGERVKIIHAGCETCAIERIEWKGSKVAIMNQLCCVPLDFLDLPNAKIRDAASND